MKHLFLYIFLLFLCGCSNEYTIIKSTNLYALPSVSSEAIEKLTKGTSVPLKFKVYNWCYVNEKGYLQCDTIDIQMQSGILSGKTVIVDAGHGGFDNGAIVDNVNEKDINLSVTKHLANRLYEDGANVILTRYDDTFESLYNRPTLANWIAMCEVYIREQNIEEKASIGEIIKNLETIYYQNRTLPYLYQKTGTINEELATIFHLTSSLNDIIFVSIHSNVTGTDDIQLEGLDIIYSDNTLADKYPGYTYYDEERRILLANSIASSIEEYVPITLRKIYSGDYAVLREQALPSVLIELGYMDNEYDLSLLTSRKEQRNYAKGIEEGIINYFAETKKIE